MFQPCGAHLSVGHVSSWFRPVPGCDGASGVLHQGDQVSRLPPGHHRVGTGSRGSCYISGPSHIIQAVTVVIMQVPAKISLLTMVGKQLRREHISSLKSMPNSGITGFDSALTFSGPKPLLN